LDQLQDVGLFARFYAEVQKEFVASPGAAQLMKLSVA